MTASRVFMVTVAFGLGALWSAFIIALCQAAKRGDEANAEAWRPIRVPDELEARNN